MSDPFLKEPEKLSWRFPRTFWIANTAELFERAAFYGMFIALTLYLTRRVGFTDIEAGYVGMCFASVIYLLPTFLGAMADRIGFRRSLILAFALLTGGYALLGAFQLKSTAIAALALIMFGGAIVKPVISATVAKCSDAAHRARAFSIFYQVVNIGAFTGKMAAKPLRVELGLEYINFYAAGMAFMALLFVLCFYRDVGASAAAKSPMEALKGLFKVLLNFRFMGLILIVAGFWVIQGQLYATMPKYLTRLIGETASPEWLANINPAVVVICVIPITHLIRHFQPANAIAIGLLIIPMSALSISLAPVLRSLTGDTVDFGWFALHPITVMVIIGIALQGLAECFLSPKFLEYASKQAPEGEEGLYLGYQHLTTFFAWLFGFGISGHLLAAYCPDPQTISQPAYRQWVRGTDAGYRFELEPQLESQLRPGSLAGSPVLARFEQEKIALPRHARIGRTSLAPAAAGAEDVIVARLMYPEGVAIHPDASNVYWSDRFDGKVKRAPLDGSDPKVLEKLELEAPRGMAIDTATSKLYIVDAGTNALLEADLDGGNARILFKPDARSVYGIDVDPRAGMIYWSEPEEGRIRRARLDGSGVEDVWTGDPGSVRGIALDAAGGKVYWCDGLARSIRSIELETGLVETSAAEVAEAPRGIAWDGSSGALYWAEYSIASLTEAKQGETWTIDSDTGEYRIEKADGELYVYKEQRALPDMYHEAHVIWYYFTGVGVLAFMAMLVYKYITRAVDRRRAMERAA